MQTNLPITSRLLALPLTLTHGANLAGG